DLSNDSRVYTNLAKFIVSALVHMVSENTDLVHNAGEIDLKKWSFIHELALLPVAAGVRLRGGRVFRIGASLRQVDSLGARLFKPFTKLDTFTVWRDPVSREFVRRGSVAPDWAFHEYFVSPPNHA